MRSIELCEVGDSTGLIIPAVLLEKMGVGAGDYLSVNETPNGIELTPCDSDFSEAIKIAEKVMSEDRDILRKLND